MYFCLNSTYSDEGPAKELTKNDLTVSTMWSVIATEIAKPEKKKEELVK
jgi:hypothetical protein